MTGLINTIQTHQNIEVFLNSQITQVDGFVGNFKTTVLKDGTQTVLEHGVTLIASGASELKTDQHLYGQDPRVVTGLELQRRFIENDPALGQLKTAVFVQCVGSRTPDRPYCSKVCCTQSIKSALKLKEINPATDVFVLYRDLRPYGLREDLYRKARSAGIVFIRYNSDKAFNVALEQEDLHVTFADRVLGRQMEIRPDLLILASAVVPDMENPLARFYKVPQNQDGFFAEAHVKLRPVDFSNDGVYMAGLAHYPKLLDETIVQAQAAAARAATILSKEQLSVGGIVVEVDAELCVGCLTCVRACPYDVPQIQADLAGVGGILGAAHINPAQCRGCGICVGECPAKAIQLAHYRDEQMEAKIDAFFPMSETRVVEPAALVM